MRELIGYDPIVHGQYCGRTVSRQRYCCLIIWAADIVSCGGGWRGMGAALVARLLTAGGVDIMVGPINVVIFSLLLQVLSSTRSRV